MANALQRFSVIYARIGPRGKYKKRPAIVIGEVAIPCAKIKIVVCSTDFAVPIQPNEVLLPSGPPWPHPLTGLTAETVAVWDWLEEIDVSEIENYGGQIPNESALAILKKIKAKFSTTDPNLLPAGKHVPKK